MYIYTRHIPQWFATVQRCWLSASRIHLHLRHRHHCHDRIVIVLVFVFFFFFPWAVVGFWKMYTQHREKKTWPSSSVRSSSMVLLTGRNRCDRLCTQFAVVAHFLLVFRCYFSMVIFVLYQCWCAFSLETLLYYLELSEHPRACIHSFSPDHTRTQIFSDALLYMYLSLYGLPPLSSEAPDHDHALWSAYRVESA